MTPTEALTTRGGSVGGLRPRLIAFRAARAERRSTLLRRRDRVLLGLAVVPALAWLAFAQGYPLVDSLWISFQHWSLAASPTPQGFAGLGNYRAALSDPEFTHSLRLGGLFVLTVPVELVVGFMLAYLTQGESRRMRVLRTILIIPMVIAPIAIGSIFRLVLDPTSGILDIILRAVGLPSVNWLGGQSSAVVSALGIDVWEWVPFSMVIFAAALSAIDPELIAAAQVDGARSWRVLRHILIPLTLPATLLICVFRLIDAFLVIDVVYSLTYGGPGFSTQTPTLWVFNQGLKYFNLSEAAAASWILLLICVFAAIALLRLKTITERHVRGQAT